MNTENSIALRAGDFDLVFDPSVLAFRAIRCAGRVVLDGCCPSVRDRHWGTVLPRMETCELRRGDEAFELDVEARVVDAAAGIDWFWRLRVSGCAQGLRFEARGRADSDFERNRIGWCVLHPASMAGRRFSFWRTEDGSEGEACFPVRIVPHQPARGFQRLRHLIDPAFPQTRLRLDFEGETFEMEDQRNWTDASYKSYCTPLERPYPVALKRGDEVAQAIDLRREGPALPPAPEPEAACVAVGRVLGPMPPWGLQFNGGLGAGAMVALRALGAAHLRVEVHAAHDGQRLREAAAQARELGLALEVVLFCEAPRWPAALPAWLRDTHRRAAPPLARLILLPVAASLMPAALFEALATDLRECCPGVPVLSGTDHFFVDVNRGSAALGAQSCDGLAYSLNPQVHQFDDAALFETLPWQGATVAQAREIHSRVAVTPITLRIRPDAARRMATGSLSRADARQHGERLAAWTMGAFASLAAAGVASTTWFETAGPAGWVDHDGTPSPAACAMARLATWRGASVHACRCTGPVIALALVRGEALGLWVVNTSATAQRVRIEARDEVDATVSLAPLSMALHQGRWEGER